MNAFESVEQPAPEIKVSDNTLRSCLERAIERFNKCDRETLLSPQRHPSSLYAQKGEKGWYGASERSISHRLAVYLECELRKAGVVQDRGPVVVDCEYNRHLDGMKTHRIPEKLVNIVEDARRKAKPLSDDEGYFVFSVAPDIIVHQRNEDDLNLLVIEVKKASNIEIPEYDDLKLRCFTKTGEDDYRYQLGFSVEALDDVPIEQRELKLSKPYAHGQEQPQDYGK